MFLAVFSFYPTAVTLTFHRVHMNSPLTADDNFVITNPLDKGVGIPLTLPPPSLIILPVTAVGAVTRTSAFDLLV